MQKRIGLAFLGAIIVIIAITVVATHHSGMGGMNMSVGSAGAGSQNAVATNAVAIQNYAFAPMAVKVKVGTTVTWTNQDSVHHTITMDSGSSNGPESGDVGLNQKYSYTFKSTGTYNYHCKIHPQMHGTVVVIQ